MAGFDVVAAVEYDPVHAATHLYNFPSTEVLCRDIKTVSAAELLDAAEGGWKKHNPGLSKWDREVDVIVGGPSCQGFSIMGRKDERDERNDLVFEFVRLVEEIRPKAFCMENVPGLLHARFDGLRERALDRLRIAGYAISGHTDALVATDYGVPQKRRRVLILGTRIGAAPRVPVSGYPKSRTVGTAFAGLSALSAHPETTDSDRIDLTDDEVVFLRNGSDPYSRYLRGNGGKPWHGHVRQFDEAVLTGCKITQHRAESTKRFATTKQGGTEPVSRAYRLSESAPALTLRAGTGRERGAFSASRPLHPTEPRVITVREAARLHSFPDWFRFHTTNWHGHRQIGNAVPPLLARAAGRSLMEALGRRATASKLEPQLLGDELLLSLSPTEAAKYLDADINQVPQVRTREASSESNELVDSVVEDGIAA